MTTLMETILSSLGTGLLTFLATFHILKYKERKRLQDGYVHIEDTLRKMYQALCDCNGMGEQFDKNFKRITESEDNITGG